MLSSWEMGLFISNYIKILQENQQYSPSDVMKNYFEKINRLGFYLWIVNVIQFRKSSSVPFYTRIYLFFILWWWQTLGFKGASVKRWYVEKSRRAQKVRDLSDAFHFKSDVSAFRIFRLARSATALARLGFDSSFHSHTRPDTHLGHTQTLCTVRSICECTWIFLKIC